MMLLQFHTTLEIKVPQHNTRVKLPAVAKDNMYDGMCHFSMLLRVNQP